MPVVEKNEGCRGKVNYTDGFAIVDLFPTSSEFKEDDYEIGLSIYNSVNKKSAVIIKFSILHNGRLITLPKDISTYYKAHVGNVEKKTQNYIELVSKVKNAWKEILLQFNEIKIDIENIDSYVDGIKINPKHIKDLKLKMSSGTTYNLWSMFIELYDKLSNEGYSKSEIHRRQRIDEFTNKILGFSNIFRILKK